MAGDLHLVSRRPKSSGRMWTQYDAENGSYTSDNKRQGWSYDYAGNALTTFDGTYTYDAASRPVTFTSNQTWKVYPDWPSNPPDGPSLETQDMFDGTGQIAKHVNHTRTDQSVDYGDGNYYYSLGEATTTTYYVHSTALGGKTIAEVSSSGAIGDTFVYSGGAKLATQHHYSYSTAAVIEATNPVTGAAIATDANASYATRHEPDPLGRDLTSPPQPGLVSDPVSGVLKDHWMPIEYTGGPSDEASEGMAIYLDAMDMVIAREAFKRWLRVDQSEKTKNAEYNTWNNILNKNPNVGVVAGKDTYWGKSAADFLKKNANAISLGRNGIMLQQGTSRSQRPTPEEQAATRAAGLLSNNNCSNFIAELISISADVAGQSNSGQMTPSFGPLLNDARGNLTPSYGADYALEEYQAALLTY